MGAIYPTNLLTASKNIIKTPISSVTEQTLVLRQGKDSRHHSEGAPWLM